MNLGDRAYNCDRCGQDTPDGNGTHYKGERYCPDCVEVVAFWETIDEACLNCGTTNHHDDIQEGLCAKCFGALPVGEWVTAGRHDESEVYK